MQYGLILKIFLSLMSGIFLLSACSKDKPLGQEQGAIPVMTHVVKNQDIIISFEYPAQLKSLQSVGVYARVEGVLLEQHFTEGGLVKKGDKLFKIDPAKYQATANMARAQLLSAQATFKAAQRDWERAQKLFKENALSPKEYDSAQSAYENANASVASARANLDTAMIDLGYTDVVATASGKIGMKQYDIGDLVGKAGANNVLTTVTQLDPIHAEFSIPSNDYYFLRTLDRDSVKVHYVLGDGSHYDKEGRIDFVDAVIDANTATIKARSIVENPENLLVPGEFSRVKLDGFLLKNSIAIPQVALMQDKNGSYVYKIVDGKAQVAPLELGYTTGNQVIVKSGLKEGDVIVTSQLIKIRPGMPVSPMKAQESQGTK